MKRLERRSFFDSWQTFTTPPFRFYLADLKELVRIAEARKMCVAIMDDEHEFESIEELATEKGDRVKVLTIRASEKRDALLGESEIKFDDGISVRTYKKDQLVLLHQDLVGFLISKRPWYARFMRPNWWGAGIIGSFVPLYFGDSRSQELPFYVMMVCTEMMFISMLYRSLTRGVFLKRAHEIQGFWDRNGDKIVSGLIGSAIGALVARLISH